MQVLNNLKVSRKLTIAFLIPIVLMALNAFIGYRASGFIYSALDSVFTRRLPAMDYLIEADRDFQQALVAERSMLLLDPASDEFASMLADYRENVGQVDERWGKYKELISTEEESAIVPQFERDLEAWRSSTEQVVSLVSAGTQEKLAAAERLSLGEVNEKFGVAREHLNILTEMVLENATQEHSQANSDFKAATGKLLLVTILGLVLGMAIALIVGRNLSLPLGLITNRAKKLALGDIDLGSREKGELSDVSTRKDELGDIGKAFAGLIDNQAEKALAAEKVGRGELECKD